jgi:hypothetical protein
MIKKRILFIFILCLIFIVPNVTAYDMFWQKTWNSIGSGTKELNAIQVKNLDELCDITLLTMDGTFYSQFSGEGSHSGNILYGGSAHGTYTANWYNDKATDYNGLGHLQITIDSCDMTGHSGGGYVMLDGLANWGVHYLAFQKDNYYYNTESDAHTAYAGCYEQVYAPYNTTTRTYYGEPVEFSDITVNVKNLAGVNLEGIDVHVLTDVYDYSGTTVTGGNVTLNVGYNSANAELYTSPTGLYDGYSEFFSITNAEMTKFIYLQQNITGVPQYNITYHVTSSSGGVDLSGVQINHIISSGSSVNGLTDSEGTIEFTNVPSYDMAFVMASKTGYQNYNSYFAFTGDMTKEISMIPVTVTPTPTPIPTTNPSNYWSLTFYPDSINLGDSATGYLVPNNPDWMVSARVVNWYEKNNLGAYSSYNLIGSYRYNTSTSNWDFRTNNTASWNFASHDPATLEVTPDTTGTYSYQVAIFNANSVSLGTAQGSLVIGGGGASGSLIMVLGANDGLTTSHLQNYQLELTNDYTGTTQTYDVVYDKSVSLPRGTSFTMVGNKEGYDEGTTTFIVPIDSNVENGDFGTFKYVTLYPVGSQLAGNTTVTVHVDDIETYYPLGNVQIIMSYDGTSKYTGSSGESVSWNVPYNTSYTVRAVKSGYCTITESKNTGVNPSQYVPLFMKYGSCAGNLTPTPTPTITPTVTSTPIGGWGNISPVGAVVCGQIPVNATLVDVMKNSLACNGLKDTQSQSLGIACIIILICAIVLGRIAKGIGVLAGVIAGTVLSTVAGFIPFYVIILVVIIAGLVFAGKVFWSNGG